MRNRGSRWAVWLLLPLAAAAQEPAEEKRASIEGTVTNAITGAPILRAHVMCDGFAAGKQQAYGAMTNAEGKFSMTGLPGGSYMVRAERVGFVPVMDFARNGMGVQLRPGDAKTDLRLKLTPTGAIVGRVTDGEGNPVEGAQVYASLGGGIRSGGSRTDHKGHYRIGGLAPGRYRVRAEPFVWPMPPEIRTDGSEEVHWIPAFHPNAIDAKSAARLEVRSGADLTGIDIKLVRWPIVRVSGVVTGIPAGVAPQMVNVQINSERSGGGARVTEDGKFEAWNVNPGKWRVVAVYGAPDGGLRSAPVEIEVGQQNVENIELRMMPPFEIAGQVEYESESAKPRALPNGPPPPRPRLMLEDVTRSGPPAMGDIAPDGTFRLKNVHPGRYRVSTMGRAAVTSMRLGSVALEGSLLDLSSGSGGASLTVTIGPANAEISGTVKDDNGPVAGVPVMLLMPDRFEAGGATMISAVTSGADGSFRIQNVPGGKYVLLAADDADQGLMSGNIEDYEDVLARVEVRPGDRITKELKRHAQKR